MELKPIVKWVGGKTQIINDIISYFPKEIENYIEPFVGGGSVFLYVLSDSNIKVNGKYIVNDINKHLINLYLCVKNNVEQLIDKLNDICNNYKNALIIKSENLGRKKIKIDKNISIDNFIKKGKMYVYYYYREIFNTTKINNVDDASIFLFLNKTCFRGLYREGKNGFNVPFGNYKNPTIFSCEQLRTLNKIFNEKNIEFVCKDFMCLLDSINKKDFVYLDPPYVPISKTSFTKYSNNGFDIEQQKKLVLFCNILNKKKIKFVQSNSDCEFIRKKYKKYDITQISCKRRINSKNPNAEEMESIIWNLSNLSLD